jgi:hypothetical protein
MRNKDGQVVNVGRDILLLILKWGSQYIPYSVMEIENKVNKIGNFIKNNAVARWWIDVKAFVFGTPYPEYIFSDTSETDMYVTKYKIFRLGWGMAMDIMTVDNPSYALDVSRMFFIKKAILLRMINSKHELTFRTRRFLEYPKQSIGA